MENPEETIVTSLPQSGPAAQQQPGPAAQRQPGNAAQQQAERAPGAPIFDLKNVSIWYSAFKAVTDVSFSIREHEITAFIGSSGSGKTTVLRAFNRMNDLVAGARMEGEIDYRGQYGPTEQIFQDPRDERTQAYVTGRIG